MEAGQELSMILEGLAIAGYRSLGSEIQLIHPLTKINMFAGKNNAGKSNILRAIWLLLARMRAHNNLVVTFNLDPLDRHIGQGPAPLKVGIGHNPSSLQPTGGRNTPLSPGAMSVVTRIFQSEALTRDTPLTWFLYESSEADERANIALSSDQLQTVVSREEWRVLWADITQQGGGDLRTWVSESMNVLVPQIRPYKTAFIPAIREVKIGTADGQDYSGLGLIEKLAKIQNPDPLEEREREKFRAIHRFIRHVLDDDSAVLEVPHHRESLTVHIGGHSLPLESLGSGLHEVIIIAAAATVLDGHLIAIEEPEIHLHPILQRKLINYLHQQTNNQYFIATHSAHLLDTDVASVFHVRQDSGATRVRLVSTSFERWEICDDLGYRASDILQSNVVVWVEGPSDRIYVRHWLTAVDPTLIEGIHYSVMIYGGRLLAHLSADDPAVDDFISLRRLNRNLAILIDSDRRGPEHDVNQTKRRVAEEIARTGGLAWITDGREVENYLTRQVAQEAYSEVSRPQSPSFTWTGNRYHSVIPQMTGGRPAVDKIKFAHAACTRPADLSAFDLEVRMRALAAFIQRANS